MYHIYAVNSIFVRDNANIASRGSGDVLFGYTFFEILGMQSHHYSDIYPHTFIE
jgi:hypothetical protein